MSWLDWAIDDPAPGNCGYSALGISCEVDRNLRYGNTVHLVEGWFTYINPSAVMRARGNSWGVTIMRSGRVWKHRPRPTFVNWHAGGPAQNISTEAIEMEGKDQPWTTAQRASLLRVLLETWAWFGWGDVVLGGPTNKTQDGIRHDLLVAGRGSLWEHNWFDYTSCPSGRNEWDWLIARMKEDDMTDEQYMALLAAIAANDAKAQGRRDQIIAAINAADGKAQARRDQILKAITAIGAVDGPSADAIAAKTADELAERLRV